jgi:hypothetical protein
MNWNRLYDAPPRDGFHRAYNGHRTWYRDGKLHREDGPAIIELLGKGYWFINGQNITTEVNIWLDENEIRLPFNDEEKVMFKLMFL